MMRNATNGIDSSHLYVLLGLPQADFSFGFVQLAQLVSYRADFGGMCFAGVQGWACSKQLDRS